MAATSATLSSMNENQRNSAAMANSGMTSFSIATFAFSSLRSISTRVCTKSLRSFFNSLATCAMLLPFSLVTVGPPDAECSAEHERDARDHRDHAQRVLAHDAPRALLRVRHAPLRVLLPLLGGGGEVAPAARLLFHAHEASGKVAHQAHRAAERSADLLGALR